MKALTILCMLGLLAFSASAPADDKEVRLDIAKDIPLAEAIRRANEQFPDAQPLTEDEVIAAVRGIKLTHPDIKAEIYEVYMRVVRERVLPKDMYFSRITSYSNPNANGVFQVDWKDLTLRGRIANADESNEILSKVPDNIRVSGEGFRLGGFNYRIRARFISSQPKTAQGPR